MSFLAPIVAHTVSGLVPEPNSPGAKVAADAATDRFKSTMAPIIGGPGMVPPGAGIKGGGPSEVNHNLNPMQFMGIGNLAAGAVKGITGAIGRIF